MMYDDLDRLAVTLGPGSFTGVRVGIAVARGLALSRDVPVAGISTLDACHAAAKEIDAEADCIALLDARRGELYCRFPGKQPFVGSYDDVEKAIGECTNPVLCGSGAPVINKVFEKDYPVIHTQSAPQITLVARLASEMKTPLAAPEPLYLRPPDAKTQTGFALEHA